jgi:hypothetical protein
VNHQYLIARATAAYMKFCRTLRLRSERPSPVRSYVVAEPDGNCVIYLVDPSQRGLARYRYRKITGRLARLRGRQTTPTPRDPTVVRVPRSLADDLRRIGQSHGISVHHAATALLRDAVARYLAVDHIGSSHRLCEDDLAILEGAGPLLQGDALSDAN